MAITMKSITLSQLRKHFAKATQNFPVSMAYVYGSYADGTFTKNSDIDIALVIKESMEKLALIRMEMKIAARLDKLFGFSFDIRCINDAPLKTKGEIITCGKLVYCSNEDFRVSFETWIRSRYQGVSLVKAEIIENRIKKLQEYLEKLSQLSGIDKKNFLTDFRNTESSKYLLQVSIECCLDIANHIIASEKFRSPLDYADSFRVLNEQKIVPDSLIERLIEMAKFRNRLVHIYWEIDNELIYEIVKDYLDDFSQYSQVILKIL